MVIIALMTKLNVIMRVFGWEIWAIVQLSKMVWKF